MIRRRRQESPASRPTRSFTPALLTTASSRLARASASSTAARHCDDVGQLGGDGFHARARCRELARDLTRGGGIAIDDDRHAAFGGNRAHDRRADALGAAGDEDDLAGQIEIHSRSARKTAPRCRQTIRRARPPRARPRTRRRRPERARTSRRRDTPASRTRTSRDRRRTRRRRRQDTAGGVPDASRSSRLRSRAPRSCSRHSAAGQVPSRGSPTAPGAPP